MRQVGIFAPTHQNILANFCSILGGEGAELTVFTTDEIADQVRDDVDRGRAQISWITRGDRGVGSFLSSVESRSSELDLLIIDSFYGGIVDLLKAQRFRPTCPTLFWVYNVRSWVGEPMTVRHGVVGNLNILCRRRLLSRLGPIVVEYPPLQEYVRSETDFEGAVYCLAPTLYEAGRSETGSQARAGGTVQVTIPGYIEEQRRDYEAVLDSFEELVSENLSVCLLGRPKGEYGRRIIERARNLDDSGLPVTTYEDWIPIETFRRQLAATDLLLCPLRETIEKAYCRETYGTTKGSGCVWDAIRSESPLLVPEHFAVADYIDSSTVTYDGTAGLEVALRELSRNPDDLEALARAASENSHEFTLEKQRDRYDSVLADVIDDART